MFKYNWCLKKKKKFARLPRLPLIRIWEIFEGNCLPMLLF